jgi:hypothetical protein
LPENTVKSRLSGILLVQVDAGRFTLVQVNAGVSHHPASVKNRHLPASGLEMRCTDLHRGAPFTRQIQI